MFNQEIPTIELPDGSFASFCGFWYDSITQTGYLEPMVTAKEYRTLGLGKANVYHSLQILKTFGCKRVFTDSDEEPFNYYCKLGFEKNNYNQCFKKVFPQ